MGDNFTEFCKPLLQGTCKSLNRKRLVCTRIISATTFLETLISVSLSKSAEEKSHSTSDSCKRHQKFSHLRALFHGNFSLKYVLKIKKKISKIMKCFLIIFISSSYSKKIVISC